MCYCSHSCVIAVCLHGFSWPKKTYKGKPLKYNQIAAYSVRHRWFPRLFERLQVKTFSAVVFLENNCILQHTWAELLHTVTGQGPAKDIFWLGFRKLWPHQRENDPNHRLRKKVQGSKCIVLRKAGVQRLWDALVQNDSYWHYDMMLQCIGTIV